MCCRLTGIALLEVQLAMVDGIKGEHPPESLICRASHPIDCLHQLIIL